MKLNANEGEGRELADRYGIQGVPQMVFIQKDGTELDRIVGYLPPEEYAKRLAEITAGKNTIPDLETRRNENPRDLELLSLLAEKYQNANDTEQAREVYESILNQFSDSSDENVNKARFFLAMQDFFDGNAATIEYFIHKNPQSVFVRSAYEEMYRFYRANGKQDEEMKILDAMVEKFPDDPGVLNSFAWRMTEVELNLEEALEYAQKAVALTAGDPQGQSNIIDTEAEILWKLNRIDDAIAAIKKAIELDPENGYFETQLAKFSSSEPTE